MSDQPTLRTGYTTGACAAAAAKAAFGRIAAGEKVDVKFPDHSYHQFTISGCEIRNSGAAEAWVIKDAGDDPDVTDQAKISALVASFSGEINEHDFELECGQAKVILRGGEGVGYSTRFGPDVPVGKWAINPIPRKMIINNLQEAGCGNEAGTWLVEIAIADGEELAKKTLNPTLGIVGGLSVLGITGIVEPKSHAAYIETIRMLLKGIVENHTSGKMTAVLCTGARTQRAVAADFPEFPEHAYIRIGDYIAESLKFSADYQLDKVIIGCMVGKLAKYAAGFENTHAHKVKMDIATLEPALKSCKVSAETCKKVLSALTIREALECLDKEDFNPVLDFVGQQALEHIKKWCPGPSCEIRTYDYEGKLLGKWPVLQFINKQ